MFHEWIQAEVSFEFFVTNRDLCYSICNGHVREVPLLKCDHVEADTHLFFHSKHAAQTYSAILLSSSDLDVYVIDLCHAAKISAALCSELGKCYDLLAYDKDSRMTFKINPARQNYNLIYVLFTGLKEKEIINLTRSAKALTTSPLPKVYLAFTYSPV